MQKASEHDRTRWVHWGLIACLCGAIVAQIGFSTELFPVLDEGIGGESRADQARAIDADLGQWRLSWLISMPARIAIGLGLVCLAAGIAAPWRGRRRTAARIAAVAALINVPLGIARFMITLGNAEYAADPGVWFDILWVAHWLGTIVATTVIVWLTYGKLSARWAAVVLALFTVLGVALVAAPPIYAGIGVYAAAALWRNRGRSSESLPSRRAQAAADVGRTTPDLKGPIRRPPTQCRASTSTTSE